MERGSASPASPMRVVDARAAFNPPTLRLPSWFVSEQAWCTQEGVIVERSILASASPAPLPK